MAVLVQVSARRFDVPLECPCCGATPDSELVVPLSPNPELAVAPDSARELVFPYCRRCIAHAAQWDTAPTLAVGVMLAGAVAAIVLTIALDIRFGGGALAVAALAAGLAFRARRATATGARGESCATATRALAYLGWTGNESSLDFESHAYAAKFAEQNQDRLAHPSAQLSRLLEGLRIARLTVPTPATAVSTVPPPATLADWIGRLESASSAVARRTMFQRAIDALQDGADRIQLTAAATRLELAPFLDEVRGMSPIAAKSRLERAMATIRADNIPSELQGAVLRELEARWKQV